MLDLARGDRGASHASGPFGIRETILVWRGRTRALWLGAVGLVAVALVAMARGPVAPPGFYRPPPLEAHELVGAWCADGVLLAPPPRAHCRVLDPTGTARNRYQSELEAFAARQPPRMLRPRPPHRYTLAVLAALLGALVWWWVRPVQVEVSPHRVRIGSRTFSRFELQGCRIARFLGRPRLVLRTTHGEFRSPPLQQPAWMLEGLCAQINGLVASPAEALNERIAAHRLRRELQAVQQWGGGQRPS